MRNPKGKEATAELSVLAQSWQNAFDILPDPVMVLDPNHRIISLNTATLQLLGLSEKELIGRPCYTFFHRTSQPPDFCPYVQVLRDKGPHSASVVFHKGLEAHHQVSVKPVLNGQGEILGCIHSSHDISELKEREKELTETKEDLKEFLENASDLIQCMSPKGDFLYVNKAWKKTLGYSDEEVSRLNLMDILSPCCVEMCQKNFAKVIEGQPVSGIETVVRTKDGREVILEGGCTCKFQDGKPVAARGIFRDVTERKRMEQALRDSEERLRTLINATPDIICFKDGRGRWLEANDAMIKLFGLYALGYQGKTEVELAGLRPFHREAFFTFQSSGEQAWRHRKITRGEQVIRRTDGTVKVFDIITVPLFNNDGARRGLVVLGRDITVLKETEEALKHLSHEQNTILENVPVGISFVKYRRFVRVNRKFLEISGYSAAEVIGSTPEIFYKSREEFEEFGEKAYPILAQGLTYQAEVEFRKKSGDLFWCRMVGKAIAPPDLSKGVIWIHEDISTLKEAEKQQRRLQENILHAQKLESLGILAGGIAHDFNNLLMGILGFADLALLKIPSDSPAASYIYQIQIAAQRAGELTNQMLAYSGKGKFIVEPVDLSELVREMGSLLQAVISKKVSLRYLLAQDLPPIEADVTQLRQVVMNLITNASEAIGENPGEILVETGCTWADGWDLANTYVGQDLDSGEYVYLKVVDTGCGMDQSTQAKIFDPFFTTKFSGRGLGLAAVLGIVRGHKGTIHLESEPGRGTVFTVMFPAKRKEAQRSPQSERTVRSGKDFQGEGTILVVDDEETVREVAKIMLEELGFRVLTAEDGFQALKILERDEDDIRAVILDMTMPRMDGKETLKHLKRISPNVKVILSSGYTEQHTQKALGEEKLAGFIQKPYELSALASTLEKILES